jgi:phosphatidylinositol glycan class P protein
MNSTTLINNSVYSFVGWIASFGVYFCFLGWAFLPEVYLQTLGITYYPSRYYAIALPAYCVVVYLLAGMFYVGYNMMNTLDPEEIGTFRDINPSTQHFTPPVYSRCGAKEGIPDMADIDILHLSKVIK